MALGWTHFLAMDRISCSDGEVGGDLGIVVYELKTLVARVREKEGSPARALVLDAVGLSVLQHEDAGDELYECVCACLLVGCGGCCALPVG